MNDDLCPDIEQIERLCNEKGWTLDDLTEKLAVDPRTWTKIKGEQPDVAIATMKRVATTLGAPLGAVTKRLSNERPRVSRRLLATAATLLVSVLALGGIVWAPKLFDTGKSNEIRAVGDESTSTISQKRGASTTPKSPEPRSEQEIGDPEVRGAAFEMVAKEDQPEGKIELPTKDQKVGPDIDAKGTNSRLARDQKLIMAIQASKDSLFWKEPWIESEKGHWTVTVFEGSQNEGKRSLCLYALGPKAAKEAEVWIQKCRDEGDCRAVKIDLLPDDAYRLDSVIVTFVP